MSDATTPVLLDGLRTPLGKYRGALQDYGSRALISHALRALIARNPELARPDGVMLGQVVQAAQGQNPARLAAADAGVDWRVSAMTVNSVCIAGLSAVADAVRRIRLEEGGVYLVGGGDSMSRAPHAAVIRPGLRKPGPVELTDTMVMDGLWCALGDEGMGELSERANTALGVTRERQDKVAARSHQLAAEATDAGRLGDEITPIEEGRGSLAADEGIRRDSTVEGLARLRPAFATDGTITAGNSSQMSDGASVGAVTSLAAAERLGRRPLARILACAETAGPDNTLHLKPANATRLALERAGLTIKDIDLFEINEAFAGVVVASTDALDIPIDIVNVNGGAIALGHPLGGTGFRLLLTLAHALHQCEGRYGVATLCGGGGQGFAIVIERVKQ